ncbi:NUDIX domain-containing protein [Paracrocinitomix mangrovi]|uniref:NUDIX hydrolase n=1 Tax=Paracrocinitomix mangrovi TaxID=2862509 RepID=UPI001C8D9766|nr:NUDIX domain-containing protein [Paracrocinitomix mangrovi]UKN01698.1 NUDIX domain-containing protein [Paracrocinitomix mangrovi]
MYKVFIDNSPKNYSLDSEEALLKTFSDHKFIEAAGGLVVRGDQYMFIKRHGKWDIPKGKRDEGESIKRCATREVEEECGVQNLEITAHLVNTWHTYYTRKGNKAIKKTYWYLMQERGKKVDVVPQLEEGITAVRFFKKSEFELIRTNTFGSIEEVLKAVERLEKI